MVLKEELHDGYLTEREYDDYVRLFRFAVDRVLRRHPQMREEVHRMTEPLIKLPSMIVDELQAEIADQKAEIAQQQALIANQESQLAGKDAEIMSKDAEIRRLQHLVSQLSASDHTS